MFLDNVDQLGVEVETAFINTINGAVLKVVRGVLLTRRGFEEKASMASNLQVSCFGYGRPICPYRKSTRLGSIPVEHSRMHGLEHALPTILLGVRRSLAPRLWKLGNLQ